MRHGESEWSRQRRFAGWTDIDLSPQGVEEAQRAGAALAAKKLRFDQAYTSVLRRAWRTLDLALQPMSATDLPVSRAWQLNERHYGALQGRNRDDVTAEFGEQAVFRWRREYIARPPALPDGDPRLPERDPLYAGLAPDRLPRTESHKDTVERVTPFWEEVLAPQIQGGSAVLVVAHTSSLRGLVKIIEGIADSDIEGFKIATAVPLIYKLDANLSPLSKRHLTTGLAARARLISTKIGPDRPGRRLG